MSIRVDPETKLCVKTSSTIKRYNLLDSASTSPKLCVNTTDGVKYVRLAEGTKSGELHVYYGGKTYYASTLRDFADADSPTTLSGLAFQRAQEDADFYGNPLEGTKYAWDRDHDSENNIYLCGAYDFSWGWYDANAHGYWEENWGGTGPFRMKLSNGSFYYTVTEPFYFVKSDNDWQTVGSKTGSVIVDGTGRAGVIYVIDVLKNGLPNYSVSTSTPILFNEGDTFGAVIVFGGYNTRSTESYRPLKYSWSPKVRLAN